MAVDLSKYRTVEAFIQGEVVKLGLKWYDDYGLIRCERGDCPIVAVARHYGIDKDKAYINGSYRYYAEKMKLDKYVANDVADAADAEDYEDDDEATGQNRQVLISILKPEDI